MSSWAIYAPRPEVYGFRFGLRGCCDAARLLPQNIAKSVRIKKGVEARAVRRPRLQIIQRGLERNIAHDAGQSPRQIRRILVRQQPGSDGGGTPQLQRRYTVEIRIQIIERTEHGEQFGRSFLADAGYSRNI